MGINLDAQKFGAVSEQINAPFQLIIMDAYGFFDDFLIEIFSSITKCVISQLELGLYFYIFSGLHKH